MVFLLYSDAELLGFSMLSKARALANLLLSHFAFFEIRSVFDPHLRRDSNILNLVDSIDQSQYGVKLSHVERFEILFDSVSPQLIFYLKG
jgi:hypothetical protein